MAIFAHFLWKITYSAKRQEGLVPVISSAGLIGFHNEALVKTAGIVIGRKGTVGNITLSHKPFWAIDTAFFIPDEPQKRDLYFTYYLLKYLELSKMNSDSAVPGLNRDNAHDIPIIIPLLEEQQRISAILKYLDQRINSLRETNTTLEAIAQTLFKSWFIDFDPVHAKAEGREPEGMDAETAALFPDGFEESELGLVPMGWKIEKVEQLLELAYGKALKATNRMIGCVPVYGSGGVTGYHNEALVNISSIIVGRKGTVGSLYWEDRPFYPIDTVFYVKSKMPLTYCYYLLKTLGLTEMNTEGAVPGLNRNNVYRLPIIIGAQRVIAAFDKTVMLLREKIFSNLEAINTLIRLRETLLSRLISGQLRL